MRVAIVGLVSALVAAKSPITITACAVVLAVVFTGCAVVTGPVWGAAQMTGAVLGGQQALVSETSRDPPCRVSKTPPARKRADKE
jgi:hypothetical protein